MHYYANFCLRWKLNLGHYSITQLKKHRIIDLIIINHKLEFITKLTTIIDTNLSSIITVCSLHFKIAFHFNASFGCIHKTNAHGTEEVEGCTIRMFNNIIAILINTVAFLVICQSTVTSIKIGIDEKVFTSTVIFYKIVHENHKFVNILYSF